MRARSRGEAASGANVNPLRRTSATAALGGKIHFAGGQNESNALQTLHMAWEPSTGRWFEYPPLPTQRTRGRALVLDGLLYVIGGRERPRMSDLVHRFVPQ